MKTQFPQYSIHSGSLILVNRTYPCQTRALRQTPGPGFRDSSTLVPVLEGSPVLMERRAATLLSALMDSIHGWRSITPVSGWRSLEEQQEIWNSSLVENGPDFTSKYVALPGHSEHQTGLAIDLGLTRPYIDFIRPDFPHTGICLSFRQNAHRFGFVERYPQGKEHITGIEYEPWHFRYVGVPHAAIMKEKGLTLEEYTDFLRQFPWESSPYRCQSDESSVLIGFVKADSAEAILYEEAWPQDSVFPCGCRQPQSPPELPGAPIHRTVSGNNVDGFIITQWEADRSYESKKTFPKTHSKAPADTAYGTGGTPNVHR